MGAAQDPRSGPGPILEAAPHHGEAWAEPPQQVLGLDAARGASPDAHGKQAQPMDISGNFLLVIRLRSLRL